MALKNAGHPYELLVTDNGSADARVIDYIRSLNPAVHIINKENKGIAPSHNTMLRMAKGDFFVLIGNDIELPPNWLARLVEDYSKIPNAGMAGIHCVETLHPEQTINDVKCHPGHNVFGTMFFGREVLKRIGYFNEVYHPYGLDDSDYSYRLNKCGFISFYINGLSSVHVENDWGQDTPYRKMKDASLSKNLALFNRSISQYDQAEQYYVSCDPNFSNSYWSKPIIKVDGKVHGFVCNSGTPIIDQPQFEGE